ncbi:MAG: MltA domain-containing protein [Phycisphaerales bacterium]
MRLRTSAALAALLLSACSSAPIDDPSLHPPGAPVRVGGERVIRDLARFDFVTGYPKRFLEQRLAFTAACDTSARSPDKGAVADANAIFEIAIEAESPEDFASRLQGEFELVELSAPDAPFPAAEGMMTGYATPEVFVRAKPDERFRFPIFGDLRAKHPELATKPRRELLASEEARAAAIAWIDDPLGWALVETNGTARLRFDDGGVKKGEPRRSIAISRVATNGLPWTSIGRWLANRGLVNAAEYTFTDVVNASIANPAKTEEAALDNERVVFFEIVKGDLFPPPVGIAGGRLIPAYSCAADQSLYPPGSVLAVVERGEGVSDPRTARIVFVHDAGGAIKGPGRIDVYFGEGTEAIARAGQERRAVEVYRLRRRGS